MRTSSAPFKVGDEAQLVSGPIRLIVTIVGNRADGQPGWTVKRRVDGATFQVSENDLTPKRLHAKKSK